MGSPPQKTQNTSNNNGELEFKRGFPFSGVPFELGSLYLLDKGNPKQERKANDVAFTTAVATIVTEKIL